MTEHRAEARPLKTLRDRHGIVHVLKYIKPSKLQAHKMIVSYVCRPHGGIVVESALIVEQDVVNCMTCLVKETR